MSAAAPAGGPASRFLDVGGPRLHWLDFGGAPELVVVCLHGVTGQAGIWADFAAATRDAFRVVALDMRGHGESERAASYDPEDYADDLDAFLDALAAPRVAIVGLSLGAMVAIRWAALRPSRAERLVAVDMPPAPGAHVAAALRAFGPYPESFASLDEAVAWASSGGDWPADPVLRADLAGRLRAGADGRLEWKADLAARSERWLALWLERAGLLWSGFAAIPVPVLVVRGAASEYVSEAECARMLDANPRCRLVDVEGAGHNVVAEAPAAFAAAVRAFLLEPEG